MRNTSLIDSVFWWKLYQQKYRLRNLKAIILIVGIFGFAILSKQNKDLFFNFIIVSAIHLPLYLLIKILIEDIFVVKVKYKNTEVICNSFESLDHDAMREAVDNFKRLYPSTDYDFIYTKQRRW